MIEAQIVDKNSLDVQKENEEPAEPSEAPCDGLKEWESL